MRWLTDRPIAHRGLHNGLDRPENSLSAFAAAVQHHHPIELDIQLLADAELVVFHDATLARMTGVAGPLAEQTTTSLKPLRLLETDQSIPTLMAVLDLVAGQVPLLLEIKSDGAVGALESSLLKVLSAYRGEFAIQSFNPYSLRWFRDHAPHLLRGQLAGTSRDTAAAWHSQWLQRHLLLSGVSEPHFVAYDLRGLPSVPTRIARRVFNRPLLAWTVRSAADQQKARRYADNFIFDPFEA